ncbi:hypothetical protein ABKV83_11685 [Enterobacter asburiae]|uniref:hypothetical protein n=1 Tax=Enterobacter asburiae TaxID=61645 RepID=UPI0032AF777B
MKNNTQPALKERIEKALEDFTKGRASMHVPPLDTDVDMVLAECGDRLSVLEARCAALAAENAGLKSAIEKHADSYIMCGYCRTERDGKNDDVCEVLDSIPATDAFLAEVRAQGVESAGEYLKQYAQGLHEEARLVLQDAGELCNGFAAQLRKGVQS